jgi:DNA-binding NarL/FixJ family response regulator
VDHEDATELLRQRFGVALPARLAEQLMRRTDSDPTLLAAILDQVEPTANGLHRLAIRWPGELTAPVVAALDALSEQSRAVIDLGAVIGREFDLAIVERVYPELEVLSGLEEASALVRQLPGHVFSFRRALAREVCYDLLGPRHRAELHEKVAGALTALGATPGARAATVVELALHLGEAAALGGGQRLDAAAAAAATAGATAESQGLPEMAAEYFGQAATFAGRAGWAPGQTGRLMVAAGTARLRAARSHEDTLLGRAALTGALRMGIRAEDPGLVAAAALGFGPRPSVGKGQTRAPRDLERLDAIRFALEGKNLDVSVLARLHARLAIETDAAEAAVKAHTLAHESGDPRALAEASLAVAALTGDEVSLVHAEREAAALEDQELLARAYELRGTAALTRLAALESDSASALVNWYALRAKAALSDEAAFAEAASLARAAGEVIDPVAARLADESLKPVLSPPVAPSPALGNLTAREREVLAWALRGVPSREIAEGLTLGERTVETHLASIYRKLGVASRVELIMKFRVTEE